MDNIYTLGKRVFTERFECRASEKELSILRQQIEDVKVYNPYDFNGKAMDGAIVTTSNPFEDSIIERMFGTPRLSEDEEDNERLLHEIMPITATINEMVELWDAFNVLRIKDVRDMVTVYNVLGDYLEAIDDYSVFSPNYTKPPKEDIIKMRSLMSSFKEFHPNIDYDSTGDDDWSSMMKLFSPVGYSDILTPEEEEVNAPNILPAKRKRQNSAPVEAGDPFGFLK